MATEFERQEEQLTLSRVHGVLCALSVGMIGAIVSASPITPALHSAVSYFSLSVILNALCYVLETGRTIVRLKPRPIVVLVFLVHSVAIFSAVGAMACAIRHVSPLAGWLFHASGDLLILGFLFVDWRRMKALGLLYDGLSRETEQFVRDRDEFGRKRDRLEQENREIQTEVAQCCCDEEPQLFPMGGSEDEIARATDMIATTQRNVENLRRLRDGKLADVTQRVADLKRVEAEIERRQAEILRRLAELDHVRVNSKPMVPNWIELRAE